MIECVVATLVVHEGNTVSLQMRQTTFWCCEKEDDCEAGLPTPTVTVSGYVTETYTQLFTVINTPSEYTSSIMAPLKLANNSTSSIVGGTIGGAALVMFFGFAFFVGSRRGWFQKQTAATNSGTRHEDGTEEYKPVPTTSELTTEQLNRNSMVSPTDSTFDWRLSILPEHPPKIGPDSETHSADIYEMPSERRQERMSDDQREQ
ncbi:hypothetical protein LOZ53_005390 [Ophidiomyces ophidiicola]|nr:hypothetical protein LOZ61_005212 [Ophidiomyces ophidiicola]KAI1922952.1 hypothetical protein LOZ60_005436 [Ophidiomyces ophidiicola]KAI1957283.1 hypothetical protein LOZ59_003949 [Ophidiomyces ophidiicola]KAI1975509.1 hypothetical protein LOZ55_004610 [Ophidiomyces ophidiicola]KAI1984638.1 hypothetical protein LOZ53_005390 [Ophidiomyces ophidiicola]